LASVQECTLNDERRHRRSASWESTPDAATSARRTS